MTIREQSDGREAVQIRLEQAAVDILRDPDATRTTKIKRFEGVLDAWAEAMRGMDTVDRTVDKTATTAEAFAGLVTGGTVALTEQSGRDFASKLTTGRPASDDTMGVVAQLTGREPQTTSEPGGSADLVERLLTR